MGANRGLTPFCVRGTLRGGERGPREEAGERGHIRRHAQVIAGGAFPPYTSSNLKWAVTAAILIFIRIDEGAMNLIIGFMKWLLKWIAIISGSLIVLAILIGGGFGAWFWWSHARHIQDLHLVVRNTNALVEAESQALGGKSAGSMCTKEFPIFVAYTNESPLIVEKIYIKITARLPNHSTNILDWSSSVSMDRIVKPKGGFGGCWKFAFDSQYEKNPGVEQAVYDANITSVVFEGE